MAQWWKSVVKQIRGGTEVKANSTRKVLGLSDELGAFLKFGNSHGGTTPGGALALYEKSTAVSIPINLVAESFASLVPIIKNGDTVELEHPILDLLKNPSPYFTKTLFLEAVAKDYLATGDTQIIALGSINRPPLELQPISPKNVTVIQGNNGLVQSFLVSGNTLPGSYVVDRRSGNRVRYISGNLRELRQIRNYSTKDNSLLRGQSPLLAAAAEARQHILGSTHNVSLLEKGGRVSLVFHFEEDFTNDEYNAVKQKVRDQYAGAQNAGEVGVTAGGKLKIEELGKTNKDMDFAQLQRMAQQAVALQYKIPLALISNDASTFNNIASAREMLYDNAVLPMADRLFSGLSSLLVPRFGLDPDKISISYDMDAIPALKMRRNEEIKLRRDINLETPNELRALLGREEIEGGDDLYVPANLIPIGSDLFTDDNLTEPKPKVIRDPDGVDD